MDRIFSASEDYWDRHYNPSYDPEKCGLNIVATLDETGLSYEFDTIMVWQDIDTLLLYWGNSSGCSCPTPFEEFTSLSSMNEIIGEDGWNNFENNINSWCKNKKN